MEERIRVLVRLDARLLPAVASACEGHVRSVQHMLTPMVHNVLQQWYVQADAETQGKSPNQLVRRFQEKLRGVDRWDVARRQLLAQLLSSHDDPGGARFVDELNKAFYTRLHVLAAAHAELGALFLAPVASGGGGGQGNYRIHADCTPSAFLHAVFKTAADDVYDNPYLFVQDVSAAHYVERRQAALARINRVIDRVLYDKTNAMVNRLWRELAARHRQPQPSKPALSERAQNTVERRSPASKRAAAAAAANKDQHYDDNDASQRNSLSSRSFASIRPRAVRAPLVTESEQSGDQSLAQSSGAQASAAASSPPATALAKPQWSETANPLPPTPPASPDASSVKSSSSRASFSGPVAMHKPRDASSRSATPPPPPKTSPVPTPANSDKNNDASSPPAQQANDAAQANAVPRVFLVDASRST